MALNLLPKNGVLFEIKHRANIKKWPEYVGIKIGYPGLVLPSNHADRSATTVYVDPDSVRKNAEIGGPPVFLDDQGGCFTFQLVGSDQMKQNLGEVGEMHEPIPGFYVGFGGQIPSGPIPLHVCYYDMTHGSVVKTDEVKHLHRIDAPILGEVKFTIQVPRLTEWGMAGKPKELQLLSADQDSIGLDELTVRATTSTIYPMVDQRGRRANAFQFSYKVKAVDSDEPGPWAIQCFPTIRVSDKTLPVHDSGELRISPLQRPCLRRSCFRKGHFFHSYRTPLLPTMF